MQKHAERSYPKPKVRGGDRERQAVTGQEQPRGATLCPKSGAAAERSYPCPRSEAAAERSNPSFKEQWLHGPWGAERGYSTFLVRRGELVKGKEQRLRFAGAAVRRYPTSKVRETQVRW